VTDEALIQGIRESIQEIVEGYEELTSDQARQDLAAERASAEIQHQGEAVKRLDALVHGEGIGKPGLETRVTLLERAEEERRKAERKRPAIAPVPSAPSAETALERVETARAVANKTRWEALAKWAAIAGGLGAGLKAAAEVATKMLGGG